MRSTVNRQSWDNELLSKLLELPDELDVFDVFDVFAPVPFVAEPVGAWPQNDYSRCLHPPGAVSNDERFAITSITTKSCPRSCDVKVTPLKINLEHNHGRLEDHVHFFSWVICRFQPLILQGVFCVSAISTLS